MKKLFQMVNPQQNIVFILFIYHLVYYLTVFIIGTNVIQLETASGAAIKNFQNAIGINVPRSRFLPVKKTSDLMLVMSNLYELKSGSLLMSEKRQFKTTPLIKLGDEHFKKVIESTSGEVPVKYVQVSKFSGRFKTIPDMLEADHLTVSGDVTFGKDVSLKVIHLENELFYGL